MTGPPPAAIVMPVVNGVGTIRAALRSCLSQRLDAPIEVIVALGPSTDGTATALAEFPAVRVVTNPSGRTPDGLNVAIAASRAPVIVRCDAQAELPAGYVAKAIRTLEATGAAVVGGRQDVVGRSPFEHGVGLAMESPLGAGGARFRRGGAAGPVETVYLGVFRRDALERVGGFDPAWERNQDYELNHRLRAAGEVVWFAPELAVTYRPRSSVGALWRQFHAYGRWKRAMLAANPTSFRPRQAAAPALVAALGLTALAVPWTGWAPIAIVALTWAVALIVGTVLAAPRPGWSWFAVTAAVMHLAWGTGFIRGGVGPRATR